LAATRSRGQGVCERESSAMLGHQDTITRAATHPRSHGWNTRRYTGSDHGQALPGRTHIPRDKRNRLACTGTRNRWRVGRMDRLRRCGTPIRCTDAPLPCTDPKIRSSTLSATLHSRPLDTVPSVGRHAAGIRRRYRVDLRDTKHCSPSRGRQASDSIRVIACHRRTDHKHGQWSGSPPLLGSCGCIFLHDGNIPTRTSSPSHSGRRPVYLRSVCKSRDYPSPDHTSNQAGRGHGHDSRTPAVGSSGH